MVTLITGGVRSGKSAYALTFAPTTGNRIFIATSEPFDEAMQLRVKNHKIEREHMGFTTVEEPVQIPKMIKANESKQVFLLIDCLTFWVNNLMHYNIDKAEMDTLFEELVENLRNTPSDVILITNETGWGNIPDNKVARNYNDILGRINQRIATVAEQVVCMVSGIPMKIKG
ncbi:MAG: bifunctional adenosylcobinamide kinase/adenosylcobinamide-phosphate guanylyltransferase [Leptospirales bacterium]